MKINYLQASKMLAFATVVSMGTATITPSSLQADTILGLYVSVNNWSPDFSGNINSGGPDISVQDQLSILDDSSTGFSAALEHPIPFVPNIKIQRTGLATNSVVTLDSDIIFDGTTFPSGSELSSQFDLGHTDYILYYELSDNVVSFDLGITFMNFDGNISLQSSLESSTVDLDDYIPAGYAKVGFDLPLTGLYAGAEGSLLSDGDNSISDYKIYLGWESDLMLGVEAGYHDFAIEWADFDGSNGDLSFDGYYVAITLHF